MTGAGIHLTAAAPTCTELPDGRTELWLWLHDVDAADAIVWLAIQLERPADRFVLREDLTDPERPRTLVFARAFDGLPTLMAAVLTGPSFADLAAARDAHLTGRLAP